uniref:Uncharacterized protein n=1 Tax=Cyprinus carpio TaxID=7962 RepID=A0A8C2FLI2_CYPCA
MSSYIPKRKQPKRLDGSCGSQSSHPGQNCIVSGWGTL